MNMDTCKLTIENHQTNLLQELYNLQKGGNFCDLTLQAEDGILTIHSVVLMAASPYLRQRWISNGLAESDHSAEQEVLNFTHVKLSVAQCIVEFIYTGVLDIATDSLHDILEFCSELGLQEAVEVCERLETENFGGVCLGELTERAEKQTPVEPVITENHNTDLDLEVSAQVLSDHYEDSTDTENVVVETKIKDKHKTNKSVKTHRKRSHNALANNSDIEKKRNNKSGEKKRKKYSKKDDSLVQVLKVPKLSISIKERKTKDDAGEKKARRRKQLQPEKKSEVKKNAKLTDVKVKPAIKNTSTETDEVDNDASVKQEVDSDSEQTKTDKVISPDSGLENMLDEIQNLIKKDETEELEKFKGVKSFSKLKVKTHNTKKKGRQKNKQDVWPCCVCGRQLTTAVRQACHHYSKHGIPYDESLKLHACDVEGCKYITASSHYLQIHKKGRHGNERPHVCEFCGKGFKLPSALVTHLNIHTNSKIFRCDECNLTFNQKGGLDIHVKKHHKGQASWTELCHLCSEKFLQKAELSWHMYTVHQIPLPDRYKVFSCDLCDYQTIRKNKLARHLDSHYDNRTWSCDVCNKKFVNKSYLNRHMRYHGEKSFKCTFDGCNYACVDNIGLKKHIRLMHTHKNYKPFVCSLCQYKTGLRGNLDKHIRTVHQLDVVTKHTVQLKMKFKGRRSGDILSKDGELITVIEDHRGEDPRRLQAMLDNSESEAENSNDKPLDMIMKDAVVYTNVGKPGDEGTASQDSVQLVTTTTAISQPTTVPYIYNGMQYLTPYTVVPLATTLPQGEMYATIDPMSLREQNFLNFANN